MGATHICITAAAIALSSACGTTVQPSSDTPNEDIPRVSRVPMTTGAAAGAYADAVRAAVLDAFGLQSFRGACPQPAWVCAIDRIESHQPGSAFVTLREDWPEVLPESAWAGPPAGVGCAKWGELISRNVVNFSDAAGVEPLPRVTVYQAGAVRC